MTIGERLDIVLQDKGLSNRQAAKIMGISPQRVSQYKWDARLIPTQTVIKFCKEFNVDANWLLCLDNSDDDMVHYR